VLCTAAGAEGITLTSARILVFLQQFWSSIKNKQAADRVHRIGQERGVEIITFASRGTVDEYRLQKMNDKEVALHEILRDDEVRIEMLGWGKKKR
jgi:SNF2 family DNA or RNA helicase